ncbi:MAG: folate-binding protein YgfZ [Rhodospirillales bacterium]|jgi:tRNA-modifying protein YgfZ|nr:folate-binding protein YgfZ [Rhodospirillales bacterium]
MPSFTILKDRALIGLTGADARSFLQGLISNDVAKVGPERAIYAAFLTAQGKYLFDFFVIQMGETLLLDCEAARAPDFLRRLSMYKLRASVEITERSDEFAVAAVFGDGVAQCMGLEDVAGQACECGGGIAFMDPRLAAAGARAILPVGRDIAGCTPATFEDYDEGRLRLGLPDGSRDMIVEKTLLLEAGFAELNGVDWDKGCFLGQELTARTKYRGLVKRRLVPVNVQGPLPDPGTPILADGREVGEMRSGLAGLGMAVMRIEAVNGTAECSAGETRILPIKPDWAEF